MERHTLAVADLIPGDIIIAKGWTVDWYPRAAPRALGGTMLPCDRSDNSVPFVVSDYYKDSETPVDILREV